jgi:hypothetical protein
MPKAACPETLSSHSATCRPPLPREPASRRCRRHANFNPVDDPRRTARARAGERGSDSLAERGVQAGLGAPATALPGQVGSQARFVDYCRGGLL